MNNENIVYLYQQGDRKALERLIEGNRGIVIKLANKYNGINRTLELEDLIQEGIIGLIAAANKYNFDMDHKAKFITYAVYYIDRYINSCVNGRSDKEIRNNKFYSKCTSLNIPIGNEDDGELGDIIKCNSNEIESLEERIYREQLRKQLEGIMEEVTTLEEREVLKLHYGWNCNPCTFEYIGNIFNYTKNKTRGIEDRALRKIRATPWGRKRIKEIYTDNEENRYDNIDTWIRNMDYMIKYRGIKM